MLFSDLATPRIPALGEEEIGPIAGPQERPVKYLKFDPVQVQVQGDAVVLSRNQLFSTGTTREFKTKPT